MIRKKILSIILLLTICGCINKKDDWDGDGLPNEIEKKGWHIKVFYPTNNTSISYNVSSDPTKKDTDEDGLTDFEEWKIGSNPTDWKHDIDFDYFIDYYEMLYYRKRGIENKTILEYIQNPDVDEDGIKDGIDIDPLRDVKIKVRIKEIFLKTNMADKDGIIEIRINVSTGKDWAEFPSSAPLNFHPIIPNKNESMNYSCILDANDSGEPGNGTFPLMIVVYDLDFDPVERNWNDGIRDYDIVRIYKIYGAYAKNFNIFKDCKEYYIEGMDGWMKFEIIDASV